MNDRLLNTIGHASYHEPEKKVKSLGGSDVREKGKEVPVYKLEWLITGKPVGFINFLTIY
jgi:hypothetical protein